MWYGSKTELTNNFDAPIHWGVRAKSEGCVYKQYNTKMSFIISIMN